MVGSLSLGEEKQETLVDRCIPVKTNAEHAVVPERRHKQVLVLPSLSKHRQGAVTEGDLAHAAPVPDIEDIVTITISS